MGRRIPPETIARIRKLLTEWRLSQRRAAREADVARSTIQKYADKKSGTGR
jgi:predicted XRE-type DNA-binding protein